MGKETGIKWTDSTHNPWIGCTKILNNLACINCYAEDVDKRGGGGHWGHGAPRRRMVESTRNDPYRWNRAADKFFAEHGRRQRVFTLSMGDLFDNEVPDDWRTEHFDVMTETANLEWQICTKRVSNIEKMVPTAWHSPILGDNTKYAGYGFGWPQHIGVLITIVTQAEADRDVPRLLELKKSFGIPWVGISYEPAQELVRFDKFMGFTGKTLHGASLDWIIFGGKSGGQWDDRPFDIKWGYDVELACRASDTAFFFKQVAAFRPTDAMIPPDLMIRQWPKGH
jgi:protein gp37